MIQHDMMLFDHGNPARREQSPSADIDVEFRNASRQRRASSQLAAVWERVNQLYATDYRAQVGNRMTNTDSWPFMDHVAAISVRENQREFEIGRGSNPQWHRATDNYGFYSDADFRLGFNATQTALAGIGHLAGVHLVR